MSLKAVAAAPELIESLLEPANRPFREFYEYWLGKAAGRPLPARADIDPLEIPQLLADIFLMDVVPGPPRRFRFRLVGTHITELEGEMTGKFLDEFVPGSPGTPMARHYDEAVAGHIYLRHETLYWRERGHVSYDVLLLPLSGDGRAVDMLFGLAIYRAK